jgi:hypothetical protein
VAVGLAGASVAWSSATAAAPIGGSHAAGSHNVIMMLRDQHTNLAVAKGASSPRVLAARRDQAPLLASARMLGARNVRGFGLVNGFAATLNAAQASQLAADPAVAGIYPDRMVTRPAVTREPSVAGPAVSHATSQICPTDPTRPLLEPEALQTTHTAFTNLATPQAQSLATGAGVKVAWIADGIDIDNPDFIRSDGSHVIVDYQDFSGEGVDAPTDALESFGDASSIAAQGLHTYSLTDYVNTAHPLPAGCTITVRGMAPGATLVGLKVFGNQNSAPTSRFIEAIDYAVNVAGVDVLNESFGANLYPDFSLDPVALADDAAAAAGVTVVSGTGDAGTSGTLQTPGSDPNVISVAGTTTFRSYAQTGQSGFQLSNGTWANDNISSLSGGGTTQSGRVPDLSAPGDLGWALCSPDISTYLGCTDFNGNPTAIQLFGGTSESSPLVSGAAALVIQAYKDTHHGVRPSPALVKTLLTSTATDLGHPGYEQGSGEVNALAAVKAARSWHDANGSPARHTDAIVVGPTQVTMSGLPGQTVHRSLTLANVSGGAQTVHLSTRKIGPVISKDAGTMTLDTTTAPTFIDVVGTVRAYVTHTFTVPRGAQRLDASIAATSPLALPRMTLLDPSGRFTAYDIPQGFGNFGHVDVRYPAPGRWTAIVFMSRASGFDGPVHFSFTTEGFASAGEVGPADLTIPAGATGTVTVTSKLSSQVGDVSASVQVTRSHGAAVSVPLTQRTQIPTNHKVNAFTGTITGGNGRQPGFTGANQAYVAVVPPGKKDMSIGVDLPTDPGDVIVGVLTGPDGQVASIQSNLNLDTAGNVVLSNGFVVNRRDPKPGTWVFWFYVIDPVTGLEVSQTFHAKLSFDTVKVQANLPHSAGHTLAAGVPVTFPVTITNTGVAPQLYFTDARLSATGDYHLGDIFGTPSTLPLPVPPGVLPVWLVPPDMTHLALTANADAGVNLDLEFTSGTPEIYSANVDNSATSSLDAASVSAGYWSASIGQTGPFDGPAPAGTVTLDAVVHGQLFDPAVTSTTGDIWQAGIASDPDAVIASLLRAGHALRTGLTSNVGTSAVHAAASPQVTPGDPTGPLTIAPGQIATVWVTITPTGPAHGVVHGHLYVDTFGFFQGAGDELVDLPYEYTVG